jgi:hypothetical protein
VASALAIGSVPCTASAATKKECADAYVAGQAKRDAGQLTLARQQLSLCASDSCPRVLRGDCIEWLRDVDERFPSVVVRAVDADGKDLLDAVVAIDGDPPIAVNGRPVELDPGAHELEVFVGARSGKERVVLAEGDKARIVVVTMPGVVAAPSTPEIRASPSMPAPPAAPGATAPPLLAVEPSPARLSPWPFVVGGVGIAALGGAGVFYATGLSDGASLRDRCGSPPTCSQSDVDSAHQKLVAGDVLAGVGLVAVGVATVLLLMAPRTPASTARTPPRAMVSF